MNNSPIEIIESAIKKYKPKFIFCLFSGGDDSLSVTNYTVKYLKDRLTGVLHINTGIGIPETTDFVRHTAKTEKWNFFEYKAVENTKADGSPDPKIYEDMVLKHGFPGPDMHQQMYNLLKERQLRKLMRDFREKRGDKFMFISGIRKNESMRRMGYNAPFNTVESQIWVCPFFYKEKIELMDYLHENKIERNPVAKLIHKSGECLCGAYAKKGELSELEMWFPKVAKRIKDLEIKVKKAGFPWGWEEAPPWWWTAHKQGQQFLEGFEPEGFSHMCSSCEHVGDVKPVIREIS